MRRKGSISFKNGGIRRAARIRKRRNEMERNLLRLLKEF